MSKFDEQILVVPRSVIFNDEKNAFNGNIGKEDPRYKEIVSTIVGFEVKRSGDMEEIPKYKQLIRYVLSESEQGDSSLVYRRLVGAGEERLHGLLSIGVGGHMNDVREVADIDSKLSVNAARELEEEVGLSAESVKDMEIMC